MALSFREEHRQAIAFLNDFGGEKGRFFGVEIGAVRIGGSPPAPLFKLAAQPNDFHAQAAAAAKASSEDASGIGALYAAFWERFEARFGGELDWEPLDNRRASQIAIYMPGDVTQADHHDTGNA